MDQPRRHEGTKVRGSSSFRAFVFSWLVGLFAVSVTVGGAASLHSSSVRLQPDTTYDQSPAPGPQSLVRTYCVSCHNDTAKTGGLSLQNLDLSNIPDNAAVWERVARKLRSGEMPPSNVRSRPDSSAAAALVAQVEEAIDRAAAAH